MVGVSRMRGSIKLVILRDVDAQFMPGPPQVDHALESLVKSMAWDEATYGLEYDLDLFNIVAVDDFNMGAMENKSLNIFNSRWGEGG